MDACVLWWRRCTGRQGVWCVPKVQLLCPVQGARSPLRCAWGASLMMALKSSGQQVSGAASCVVSANCMMATCVSQSTAAGSMERAVARGANILDGCGPQPPDNHCHLHRPLRPCPLLSLLAANTCGPLPPLPQMILIARPGLWALGSGGLSGLEVRSSPGREAAAVRQ